ncbi:MAG: type secretion system protein [Phycisphaerales bacterium]|jgi:prepilin-type N-terminal cleavage/methylation domain-containing protein|nr:type secretion system protein [Phycisphaerales bacterium]
MDPVITPLSATKFMSAPRTHSLRRPRGHAVRRGFTLVEVLAATLLVGITLPVIMRGIDMSLTLASMTRHRSEAGALAESKLNDLVAEGTWQSGSLSGDFGTDSPEYTWTGELQSWGTGQGVAGTNNVQQLDVHVFWNAPDGSQRSVTLSTFVYQSQNTSSTSGTTSGSGTSTGGS